MTCKACGQPHGCGCSDAEYAGVVPPAQRAFWARCRACGHCWPAGHYPMELNAFAATLVAARCPKCGEAHPVVARQANGNRSEEHTSELQSLMRISYAVFCLKK